jgi:hypothetical protein
MAAGRVDFVIDQGEDFTCQLIWSDFTDNPVPVTTPMRMDIKSPYGEVVHSLIVPDPPLPPDEIPGITYNTTSGLIQLHIPAVVSDTIVGGIYAYDLFVSVDDGAAYAGLQKTRLIQGQLTCRARITTGV